VIVQCPQCGADQCTHLPDAKAEARLHENEVLYRGLFELSRDALMTLAPPRWVFTSGNPAAVRMFKAKDEEDFISQRPWDLSPERQPDGRVSAEIAGEMIETALREGSHFFEWRHRRLDGQEFFADVLLTRMEIGEKTIIQATVRDITERVESEKRLKLLSQVLDHSAEGIVICDPQERILVTNKAFEQLTGFSADEAVGKTPRILQSGHQDCAFYADVWKSVLETGSWLGEMWNRRKSGEIYAEWLSISAVRDQRGALTHYVGIFSDITAHKRDQERIVHLAHYDALTDLPNRALLMDRLNQLVKVAKRRKSKVAALFIDLDRFKGVNDSLGHDVGDQLLQTLAKRLTKEVREEDTVARLGGDEFVMVFQGVDYIQDIAVRANNLLSCLAEPVTLNGYELTVTASMGVSLYPDDATNGQEMIRNADAAMYKAKGAGRNIYQFYTSDLNQRALEKLSMENALRRAIERQEFVLHYQPQVDISSGSVVGAEALIRWNHPDLGLVMPDNFISIAEERGLIVPIGNWVIEEAARQTAVWQNAGISTHIAVNVSTVQFYRKDFVEQLANSLRRHGITPNHLDLEVTESIIMRDVETTVKILDRLHVMGFQLSIDDFGTGYSSLSYLRRFPIDKIKIDQSFVKDESWSIITAIISLATSLKLRVVAEGVETREQLGQLLKLGCGQAQGFLFAPALSPEEFEKWVREWKPKYLGLVRDETELLRLLTSVHGDLPLSVTNG
jgi:diguanylate cyclase (GGDEF)-like protein/PAS domain S-box-containing protein